MFAVTFNVVNQGNAHANVMHNLALAESVGPRWKCLKLIKLHLAKDRLKHLIA